MGKIADYPCPSEREPSIWEVPEVSAGFRFPNAYKKGEDMAEIARKLRSFYNAPFCTLPFCHTVEGEAMGGIVEYGDRYAGPRTKKYVCTEAREILQLPPIDFQKGRIREVLRACRILQGQGEIIALKIAGPFTILNVLADSSIVLKWTCKEPDLLKGILDKIGTELLRYIQEACKAGVRIISYADPTCGIRIIGPRHMEWITEQFTAPFLKEAVAVLPEDAMIHLCPKTAFALTGTGKAKWVKGETCQQGISYEETCVRLIGAARLAGQACINDRKRIIKGAICTIDLV